MDNFWKEKAFGYQIYLRSFKDSNNDGIGDIQGVIDKLDYIKSLGVNFIWISPFYDSPMDDNGYDVRSYYKIHSEYGTMKTVENLIKEAHKRDIKVAFDIVLNHTSDENEWFKKSVQRVPEYEDFYYWKDPQYNDKGEMVPPNNWLSFFAGSAWKYNKKRKQYYLKIFSDKMPDINYESPKAMEEILKVVEFWSQKGADAFRVDAIAHIGKDLTFKDYKKGTKYYKLFSNQPNAYTYLNKISQVWRNYGIKSMGEIGGDATLTQLKKYTTESGLDMVFSFEQNGAFSVKDGQRECSIDAVYKSLKYKQKVNKIGGWSVLFWNNHDHQRLDAGVSCYREKNNAQLCLATIMYFLQGTPLIFNGEEIGMTNYPFQSEDDFVDVNARNDLKFAEDKEKVFKHLCEFSRDNSRTIMQWDSKKYAGFSQSTPWFKVNPNYKEINVEKQLKDKKSMLNQYKKIIATRQEMSELIHNGKTKIKKCKDVIYYTISTKTQKLCVFSNFSENNFKIPNKYMGKVLYSNKPSTERTLLPFQTIIMLIEK